MDRLWTKGCHVQVGMQAVSQTGDYIAFFNTIDGEGGAPSQAPPTRNGGACAVRGTVVNVSLHCCLTASATAAIR